ncbi:kinetochore-associated Ndc80 complex subunit spc24 [Borealophlyctis nickersoniae]|nr:kinetochore-associated Ndc80 complex subunit spc24 [Borealophlyctis nickersoniae]
MLAAAAPPPLSTDIKEALDMTQTLIDNLNVTQDAALIHSMRDLGTQTKVARETEVADAHELLKTLSKHLQSAKETADRPLRDLNTNHHATRMFTLDKEKSTVEKEINEMDSSIEALEDELERLRRELEDVRSEEEREANKDPDPHITLKLYREIGVDFEKDKNGNYVKLSVRNPKDNDIRVLDIDEKYTRYFYPNLIWDFCGGM